MGWNGESDVKGQTLDRVVWLSGGKDIEREVEETKGVNIRSGVFGHVYGVKLYLCWRRKGLVTVLTSYYQLLEEYYFGV